MDSELFDNSFQVYRRDRYTDSDKLGGGLLIGLRNTLTGSRVVFPDALNALDIEILSVKISLKGKDIYVVNCYIPPNSQNRHYPNGKNIFENLTLYLDYLEDVRSSCDEVILLGDFNLSSVDWVYCREDDVCLPTGDFSAKISDFIDNLHCLGFQQSSIVKNSLVAEGSAMHLTNIDLYHPPLMITIGNDDTDTLDHSGSDNLDLILKSGL
ncbi:hypothetical protein BGY98DRAFT_1104645 [Russula aff. rugulosa BPL654]|nr:hypothetical protein BGY98DRAFT_1104645 [Russula aff. rugulosa BPL654]